MSKLKCISIKLSLVFLPKSQMSNYSKKSKSKRKLDLWKSNTPITDSEMCQKNLWVTEQYFSLPVKVLTAVEWKSIASQTSVDERTSTDDTSQTSRVPRSSDNTVYRPLDDLTATSCTLTDLHCSSSTVRRHRCLLVVLKTNLHLFDWLRTCCRLSEAVQQIHNRLNSVESVRHGFRRSVL